MTTIRQSLLVAWSGNANLQYEKMSEIKMQLSDLQRIEESCKKESKYVKLDHGEKRALHFNAEKMEPIEAEFNGKKGTRYQCALEKYIGESS